MNKYYAPLEATSQEISLELPRGWSAKVTNPKTPSKQLDAPKRLESQ